MFVLQAGQAFREVPRVMIVDVRQGSNAVTRLGFLQPRGFELFPEHVPNGLRAIFVAFLPDQFVELMRQIFIE